MNFGLFLSISLWLCSVGEQVCANRSPSNYKNITCAKCEFFLGKMYMATTAKLSTLQSISPFQSPPFTYYIQLTNSQEQVYSPPNNPLILPPLLANPFSASRPNSRNLHSPSPVPGIHRGKHRQSDDNVCNAPREAERYNPRSQKGCNGRKSRC